MGLYCQWKYWTHESCSTLPDFIQGATEDNMKVGLRSIHPNDHSNNASYGLVQSVLVALNRCKVQVDLQQHYHVFRGGGTCSTCMKREGALVPPHPLHCFLWYTPINVALHIIMMRDSIVSSGGPPTPTSTFSHVSHIGKFPYINKSLEVGLNS